MPVFWYSMRGVFLGVLLILFALGCGSSSESQPAGMTPPTGSASAESLSSPIPASLEKYLVTKLSAEVIVDNGTPVPLTVDSTNNRVTGTIASLSAGTHTFEIAYYIDDGGTRVKVASGSTSTVVAAGTATPVTFSPSSLRYTDTDGDGFTNLAELDFGTPGAWNDRVVHPTSELARSSQNYVLSDTLGVSPTDGKTTAVGSSQSTNYTLN